MTSFLWMLNFSYLLISPVVTNGMRGPRVEDSKICSSELTEDDNDERIVALAYDKTELALNHLSFVIKRAISIRKGGYCIGEVDETLNQVPRYHVSRKFTAKYDILPVQSVEEVKKWVDKIHVVACMN